MNDLSITLRPVPHLPHISESCLPDAQVVSSAIYEVVGGALIGGISAIFGRSCLNFRSRYRAFFPVAGTVAGALSAVPRFTKWREDCVELSRINDDLTKQVAAQLKINEAMVECHASSRSCFVEQSSRKLISEEVILSEEVAQRVILNSENWLEEKENLNRVAGSTTSIDIKEVDVFPDRKIVRVRKEDLLEGCKTGAIFGSILGGVATTGILVLGVAMIPVHLMLSVTRGGAPQAIKRLFAEIGSLGALAVSLSALSTLAGAVTGTGVAVVGRVTHQLKTESVNQQLALIVANQTQLSSEQAQCDCITGECYILQPPKNLRGKEVTIIGPVAKKVTEVCRNRR